MAKIQLKRWGGGGSFANFRQICFDFAYYFILILHLCNCLIRCVCKKSFLSFWYFPWLLKKYAKSKQICRKFAKLCPPISSTEFPLLYMCCNIHHFGITKQKVIASKLQVTPTKLQVTPTKLQVTRSKLTSLTAETNKFQLTKMLFITF